MRPYVSAGVVILVAIVSPTAARAQSETDAFGVKTKNAAGVQTLRMAVTGNVDLAQVKILNSRLVVTPFATATSATPGVPSHALVLSGSGFNNLTGSATEISFTVRTNVADSSHSRLEIADNSGATVASFLSGGAFLFGDGTVVGSKSIFANTGSTTPPFIRYNATLGKWEMSADGTTASVISEGGTSGPVVSSINALSGALTLTADTASLFASSGSTITFKDNLLMHLAGAEIVVGAKTFSTAPAFTAPTPFTVSSTTKVANLNADLLDDKDSAAFIQAIIAGTGLMVSGSSPNVTIGLNPTFGDSFVKNQTNAVQPGPGFNIAGDALIGGGTRITGKLGVGISEIPTNKQFILEGTMVRIEAE